MHVPADNTLLPPESAEMHATIKWLEEARYSFIRPSGNQLKVGRINFYPNTGTIYCDGDAGASPHRGLKAFQHMVKAYTGVAKLRRI